MVNLSDEFVNDSNIIQNVIVTSFLVIILQHLNVLLEMKCHRCNLHTGLLILYSPGANRLNVELPVKVFFSTDFGSLWVTLQDQRG